MKKLQREVKQYLRERNWHKLRPSDIAKSISIEAAELLELFQWESLDIKATKKNKEKLENIKKELADVFIYALEMAALLDLDSEYIIRKKLDHAKKKYPAKLMRKIAQKKAGTNSLYLKIKKEYRMKGK